MLEHLDHLAETAATAISNIKMDKVVVWGGGAGNGGNGEVGVGAFVRDLAGTVPPVLQMLRDIGGVRVSDRFVALEDDAVAAAMGSAPETGGDGVQTVELPDPRRSKR
jgi:flotillin